MRALGEEPEEVKVLVAQSCPTLGDLVALAHQSPLSMEFSRREYSTVGCYALLWGNLPNPGIEPASPALAGVFFAATREVLDCLYVSQ